MVAWPWSLVLRGTIHRGRTDPVFWMPATAITASYAVPATTVISAVSPDPKPAAAPSRWNASQLEQRTPHSYWNLSVLSHLVTATSSSRPHFTPTFFEVVFHLERLFECASIFTLEDTEQYKVLYRSGVKESTASLLLVSFIELAPLFPL